MPNTMTVREAVAAARNEGYYVTDYSLRHWIKAGKIPARMIGNKALIFYPNLIKFMQCTDGSDNERTPGSTGIHPVQ